MAKILVPWTRQPEGLNKPNLGHPFAKNLAFIWSAAMPSAEGVTGQIATTDKTTKSAANVGRIVTASSGQINLEWARQFITTSNGSGTGDFSVMMIANPANGAAIEHVWAQKNDAAGSPFAQTALMANADANANAVNGSLCFFTYDLNVSSVAVTGAMDGLFHVWCITRSGTNLYIDKDGIQLGTASNTARNISQANRYMAIGSRGNGTTDAYTRSMAFCAGWNRALSPAERSFLGRQLNAPWQLFEPRRILVPVSVAAPSGLAANPIYGGGAAAGPLWGYVA